MAEENLFFLPVKDLCRPTVYTCAPQDRLVDVATLMKEKNVSSVVVCEEGSPVGIVTDRDFRNKVVSCAGDPRALTAGSVMASPLIVVGEEDYLFEVIYQMSKHNIHRLGVVDPSGQLSGIVTSTDIIKLETNSPQLLVRDLEAVETLDALKGIHDRVEGLVVHLNRTGVKTRDLQRLISYLNDQIFLRLVALLRRDRFADLPEGFAFVVLGSEGRREQTLKTDQDNAIVYADDLSPADVRGLEAFSQELIDSLIAIGVPPCPGGIMAKNEFWRRSQSEWAKVLDQWIAAPTPESILNCSMVSDLRTVYGDPSLEQTLWEHIVGRLGQDSIFLVRLAQNVLRFPPPVGLFGRFKVERKGDQRGWLDVKKGGIFAITEGVKALALEAGIHGTGTRERMTLLQERGVLSRDELAELEASFNYLVYTRIRSQVSAIQNGREPTNYIAPDQMNRVEQERLGSSFAAVKSFQNFLRLHFRLHLIRG